jgi:hypothetical protein
MRKFLLPVLSLSLCAMLTACGGTNNTDNDPSHGNTTSGGPAPGTEQTAGNSDTATTSLTSVQAAENAYAKIKAEWKTNAVLFYLSPTKLDATWQSSDKAEWWTIGFVTPDNNETRLVYLGGPLDGRIDDVGNKRKAEIKSTYPKDKPKYSMKQAYQTTVDNGGPTNIEASMVYYDVESLSYPGQPVWSFVYRFQTDAGEEYHYYFVDGLTNALVTAAYKRDGKQIEKSQTKAKY